MALPPFDACRRACSSPAATRSRIALRTWRPAAALRTLEATLPCLRRGGAGRDGFRV